jgi:hypothetical protein
VAIYATQAQLEAYLADTPEVSVPGDAEAVERLLQRAETAVDLILGSWPRFATGRKLDPAQLDLVQREGLARATCAAAQHLLVLDPDVLVGADDYAPGEVTVLRRAVRTSPRAVEELSGHGLIRRSGTIPAPPEPPA